MDGYKVLTYKTNGKNSGLYNCSDEDNTSSWDDDKVISCLHYTGSVTKEIYSPIYQYIYKPLLERYNSNVEGAKTFKNELLTITTIKQYNIWVDRDYYDAGVTSKVKVNYDVNLDMLTMEEIYIAPNGNKMGTVYEKVVSSYDINGNIVIVKSSFLNDLAPSTLELYLSNSLPIA